MHLNLHSSHSKNPACLVDFSQFKGWVSFCAGGMGGELFWFVGSAAAGAGQGMCSEIVETTYVFLSIFCHL